MKGFTASQGYGLALVIFLLDQITKYWVSDVLGLEALGSIEVLPLFNLTWVENYGVSMGLFQADGDVGRWSLTVLTAAIAAGVAWWMRRETNGIDILAMGLVLGGAVGNIVDRVRFGYVVDFVHLYWGDLSFYVFNVADAGITIGVALLLLRALFERKPAAREDHLEN